MRAKKKEALEKRENVEDERDEDREERNGQTVDDEQQTQSGKG